MNPYFVDKILDRGKTQFFIRKTEDMSIVAMPSKYLKHKMRAKRSPDTLKRMAFSLSYYLSYCDTKGVDIEGVFKLRYDEQFEHFTEFLQWLKRAEHSSRVRKKIPSNNTCNSYLQDVFGFYQFVTLVYEQFDGLKILSYEKVSITNRAGVKQYFTKCVFRGYLKGELSRGRTIEQDKILVLLRACSNCRDQVLLLLLAETGYRIGEVLGINYTEDIDYENKLIYVNFREDNKNGARAKNAEYRSALVDPDTFDLLLHYMSQYRDLLKNTNYLFVNLSGNTAGQPLNVNAVHAMLRRLKDKTGIEATPHMLRHYFANQRRESGWDIALISTALGHRELETTMKYLNIKTSELVEASEEYYEKNRHLFMVDELL